MTPLDDAGIREEKPWRCFGVRAKNAASMNYAPIDADGHGRPERGLL
jgi:hypothetical protein